MPWAVWAARIVTGAAFVFSGFTKGVDPWGTVYKLEQYAGVWNVPQPRSLLVIATFALCMFEFLAGVSLLTGIYRRLAPRLTFLLTFLFLLLTGYQLFVPLVDDCGCFGDAWVLSPLATFLKNVALVALLGFLCIENTRVGGLFSPLQQWVALMASGAYLATVFVIGYMAQPLVDFRPFAVGVDLLANDEGTDDIKFIYERDGMENSFNMDELPDPESGWIFKRRVDDSAADRRLRLQIEDAEGEFVTDDVIPDDGDAILVVIPELNRADLASTMYLNRIFRVAQARDVDMFAVVGAATGPDLERWADLAMASYPLFQGEDTQLKELSRGDVSMVYVSNGVIKHKISLSVVSNVSVQELEKGDISLSELLDFGGSDLLTWLNRSYFIVMMVLLFMWLQGRYRRAVQKAG